MIPLSGCGKVHVERQKIPARVLVIDDEPLVRWSLVSGLRSAGFDAIAASSGDEAIRSARQSPPPEVILLDFRIFGSDLRTLVAELRAIAPDCRFLVLATAGQDVLFVSQNRLTVVQKPFDLSDVVRLVDETVNEHRSNRADARTEGISP